MIEIFILIFLCRKIGVMAKERGLKPGIWKFYTVLAWIVFEFAGLTLGTTIFGYQNLSQDLKNINDLMGLMLFALVCAFGGYLFVRSKLEQKETLQR
jgi:hypothetical protein